MPLVKQVRPRSWREEMGAGGCTITLWSKQSPFHLFLKPFPGCQHS